MSRRVLITGASSGLGRQLALDYQQAAGRFGGVAGMHSGLMNSVKRGSPPWRLMGGMGPRCGISPPSCRRWIC